MKIITPVFAAVLFCSSASFAQSGAVLSLADAAARSAEHSYELKSRDAAVSRAEAAGRRAAALRLPGLRFRSEAVRGDDPVYVFGSLLRQKAFTMDDFALDKLNEPSPMANFSNSLELSVPLFTGFKIRDSRRLAGISAAQGRAARGFAEKGTAFETTQKYLMLLLKTELARAAGETLSSTRDELDAADRLKDKGLVLGSDYYAAQAILSSLAAAETGFTGEARAAAASLNVLMGGEAGAPVNPPAGLTRHLYSLPGERELLNGLVEKRGDITAAELQSEAAGIAKNMESNSLLPQIGAFAGVQTDTKDFSANPFRHMAGVSLTMPLGDFTRGARVEEKAAEKRQAENSALALRDAASGLIAEYYRAYEGAKAVLPQTEEAEAGARRSLELFKPMFRQGRQSVLEVVRAEAALMSARAARIETVFRLHFYYAALMFVSGDLDNVRVAEISAALSGGSNER